MDKTDVRVPYKGHEALSHAFPLYDGDDIVTGLKMYIPEVSDLSSALLAIQTYEKAHSIWKCLGKKYVPIEFAFERQEEFEHTYLPNLDSDKLVKAKRC